MQVGCPCDSEAGSRDHFSEGVSRNGWDNGSITRKKSVTSHRSDFEGQHIFEFVILETLPEHHFHYRVQPKAPGQERRSWLQGCHQPPYAEWGPLWASVSLSVKMASKDIDMIFLLYSNQKLYKLESKVKPSL